MTTLPDLETDRILARVGSAVWRSDYPDLPEPQEPPSQLNLLDWLNTGGCPADALVETARRLVAVVALSAPSFGLVSPPVFENYQKPASRNLFQDSFAAQRADQVFGMDSVVLRKLNEAVNGDPQPKSTAVAWPNEAARFIRETMASLLADGNLNFLNEAWENCPKTTRPGFPLTPLIRAWLKRPALVEPNTRSDGRIIPSSLAMVPATDRRAGKLFSNAAHIWNTEEGQTVMPGFGEAEPLAPALPLALYDLGIGPATSGGRGAPLALRLFVEAILAVPLERREIGQPVAMEITLRKLLAKLYPDSDIILHPNKYWTRLMHAVESLESPAARIPWYDPETGKGGHHRYVSVANIPRGPGALDDDVRIVVDLPRGSGTGPQVSDNLGRWGVESGTAYRALLNLAYQWHEPGRTHHPVGRGKGQRWVRNYDPTRYPNFSDDDLVRLCYPLSVTRNRRVLLQRAHQVIKSLETAGELRIEGRKILPPRPHEK